jgi:NADH:ubiquinone oxidoreductase subunit E
MSKKAKTLITTLEGEFLDFIWHGKKCKFVKIAIAKEILTLPITKEMRTSLPVSLQPHQMIQIIGKYKFAVKNKIINLKILQIKPIAATISHLALAPSKTKLLICQKSGCQKKGSQKYRQAIERNLEARGLTKSINIEETGCLGKCSMAPNIILMPTKQRLSGMTPNVIADLLANTQNNQTLNFPYETF